MSIKVPNQERELLPPGNHLGRCYSMVHLGTIPNNYGSETKLQNRVVIAWELPTLTFTTDDERELSSVISQEFTLTMGERGNLRKMIESWRGKQLTPAEADDFDLTKLLGAPCMINIIHKASAQGNTYATIASVTKVPTGLDCPPPMREQFEFNYEDKFSVEAVEALPEFLRNKVKTSQEYTAKMSGDTNEMVNQVETPPVDNSGGDDDLPF